MVRIPEHAMVEIRKVMAIQERLTQALNREPFTEEIARELGFEPKKVERILRFSLGHLSLDGGDSDEENPSLDHFLADHVIISPDSALHRAMVREHLRGIVETLDEKEFFILQHRYGLVESEILTHRALGEHFGVSDERVRQMEQKVLEKIRKCPGIEKIRSVF